MEEKIERLNSQKEFNRTKGILLEDITICQRNKDLICNFLIDCEMGKTLRNTAKKKVGLRRMTRLINILRNFAHWFNKPFDEVNQKELDEIILNLERGEYKRNLTSRKNNNFEVRRTDNSFSEGTKVYFKKAFKKFNKWLVENKLNNLDTSHIETIEIEQRDFEIITRKELNALLEHANSSFWRAFISVLWSCGFRIEESLNIRIKHIIIPHTTEDDNENYILKVVFSKNKFGIRNSEVLLDCANKYLKEWIEEYKLKENFNEDSPLFPIKYVTAFSKFRDLGKKYLNKKIGCHTFRHSSATYWCNILTHAKLCCLMGWAFSSKMPDVYIKRSNVMSDKTAVRLIKNLEMSEVKLENESLKEQLNQITLRQKETEEMLRKIASQLQTSMQIPYEGNMATISVSGLSVKDRFTPFEIKSKNKMTSDLEI